jgi:molecular chaperone GrpE (heat shock protein)
MLQQADRFQNDIKKYNEAIEKIAEGQKKLEAKRLLNDLIYEVKNMDNMYVDMVYAKQLPTMGNEIRDKIGSIRKQLDSKLKLAAST